MSNTNDLANLFSDNGNSVIKKIYAYGSKNSKDLDLFADLSFIPSNEDNSDLELYRQNIVGFVQEMFAMYSQNNEPLSVDVDVSFIHINDEGVVDWAENGNVEETNNCILDTYDIQVFNNAHYDQVNPIKRRLKQSVALKAIKTLRATLTFLSRTQYRSDIKYLLKEGGFEERFDFLDKLLGKQEFAKINDFRKKQNTVEIYKDLAFYYAQLYALMNGNEIFTKEKACLTYPDIAPYILREQRNGEVLENFMYEVLDELIHSIVFKEYGDALRFDGEESFYSNKLEERIELDRYLDLKEN